MVVSQAQIDQADSTIRATWPGYTKYIHPDTFYCTVSIASAAAQLSNTAVSINIDGSAATSQVVPQSQVFRIDDIYNYSSGDTGQQALMQFTKNKIKVLANTAPIGTQLVTNQTRPGLPGVLIYEPQSSMQINAQPVALTTGTYTDVFYVAATIYDSSFG